MRHCIDRKKASGRSLRTSSGLDEDVQRTALLNVRCPTHVQMHDLTVIQEHADMDQGIKGALEQVVQVPHALIGPMRGHAHPHLLSNPRRAASQHLPDHALSSLAVGAPALRDQVEAVRMPPIGIHRWWPGKRDGERQRGAHDVSASWMASWRWGFTKSSYCALGSISSSRDLQGLPLWSFLIRRVTWRRPSSRSSFTRPQITLMGSSR